ncbi:MAG TPA: hypothetical protein HA343_02800 [Methanomassiliicoccales archaeon]|nr:hypothetical protein [Methanomassiliicoccales archaeon]
MAKVVMMPRRGDARPAVRPDKEGCRFQLQGRMIEIDCLGCSDADDAPSERCLGAFRSALNAHREATGILMRGPQDVWVRENGVISLRTLMAAETAWEGLRGTLRSLPCPRPIPPERINRYLERVRTGSSDLFCQGEGVACASCLERQQEAIDALRSDGRKAKKTLAADRFRIIEVPGGSDR